MDQSKIRNFCIIAHIDHGKSTLADRFLEVTGTVGKRKMKEQLLDQMDLERERGITIKLQPVRMDYNGYELNLIDTPGHVDFAYEVSRSLAACEGAILVVDATQGIQAQTLANVKLAMEHDLVLIPVINKIDLPNSMPEDVAIQVKDAFGFTDEEIIFASGKTGENVDKIIEAVIKKVPAPKGDSSAPLQALIFDSKYDKHQGVIAYIRVMNGAVTTIEAIKFINTNTAASAIEVGYFAPELKKSGKLETGEVGYVVTGLREVAKARVGDTISTAHTPSSALPGYKEIKPMVFASIFPESGDDYPALRDAMDKLRLNDASLTFDPESIPSLGFGFRTGFLGLLHMDIVRERLSREFNLDLVLTAPSVAYVVQTTRDAKDTTIYNPSQLPDPSIISALLEPWITLDIIVPEKYLGSVMSLVTGRRGIYKNTSYLGTGRLNLHFEIPLANIVSDFYDKLKSISSGYASMNYDFL